MIAGSFLFILLQEDLNALFGNLIRHTPAIIELNWRYWTHTPDWLLGSPSELDLFVRILFHLTIAIDLGGVLSLHHVWDI